MLRPREIQARIRSGQTAEDVAAASGLPIEHIRRFEGPVLTERAWVAQQAQATEVRRPGGDIELGDLVSERLHAEGVDPADIAWDAWRRDDGTWVVIATFPTPAEHPRGHLDLRQRQPHDDRRRRQCRHPVSDRSAGPPAPGGSATDAVHRRPARGRG